MIKHLIATRVKFDDDTLFNQYFNMMKSVYIPSIFNQTNKNFKLGIIANEMHREIIRSVIPESVEVIFFKTMKSNSEHPNLSDDEIYENYVIKENINIQTRHDCDDWMSDNYVEKIQENYIKNIRDTKFFIIDNQPLKLDYYTGDLYKLGFSYNINMCSMFLSLCQENCTVSVFEKKHSEMRQVGVTDYFKLDGVFTNLVIHDSNKLSKIIKSDVLLEKKQTKNYDVSILIPTFNNLDYLLPCLDSVIESSKNISAEIIVGIDNCEPTLNLVKSNLQKYNDKVKFYFFDTNVGPYVIKNTLASECGSDNIIFFDSDDLMTNNCVPEIIHNLSKNEFVKFSYNDFRKNSDLQESKIYKLNGKYGEGVFGIKKNIFLYLNGFEPWRCAADSEFNWRVGSLTRKTTFIHKVLFFRRKHLNNLTVAKETGGSSDLRMKYAMKIQEKKNKKISGPLPILTKSSFYVLNSLGYLTNFNFYDDIKKLGPNQFIIYNNAEDIRIKKVLDSVNNLTNKRQNIYQLILKKQTLKPIIQEVRNANERKEYISIDNAQTVNDVINKRNFNILPKTDDLKNSNITHQTNPKKTNEVQKKLIDQMRNNLNQSQQKIIPDGFKQKKPFVKGNMKRRGGSFNF